MAFAFVGSTTASGSAGSISLAAPAGVSVGNLLVAFVAAGSSGAMTAPSVNGSGWTQISGQVNNGTTLGGSVWYRFYTAGDPASFSFTTGSATSHGTLCAYSGTVNTGSLFGTPSTGSGSTGNTTAGAVTLPTATQRVGGIRLEFLAFLSGSAPTAPSGFNADASQAGSSPGAFTYRSLSIDTAAGLGATVSTNTNAKSVGYIALAVDMMPAPAAGDLTEAGAASDAADGILPILASATEAEYNYIRNNQLVGGSAGTAGTGVEPTYWSTSAGGATLSLSYGSIGNVPYIDHIWNGVTPASGETDIRPESDATQVPANPGEQWTFSYEGQVITDDADVGNLYVELIALNSSVSEISRNALAWGSDRLTWARRSVSLTMPAGTAYALARARFDYTGTPSLNFALRMAVPQLQRGPMTEVIPTSGSMQTTTAEGAVAGTSGAASEAGAASDAASLAPLAFPVFKQAEGHLNWIRNNAFAGAAIAAWNAGGTPSGMTPFSLGVAQCDTVGFGQTTAADGTLVDYIDWHFYTPSGQTMDQPYIVYALDYRGDLPVGQGRTADATPGIPMTASLYAALIAGSTSGIQSISVNPWFADANDTPNYTEEASSAMALTGSLARYSCTVTPTNPSTRLGIFRLSFANSTGVPLDITLRIGSPVFEEGSVASRPNRTTGTWLGLAADVITEAVGGTLSDAANGTDTSSSSRTINAAVSEAGAGADATSSSMTAAAAQAEAGAAADSASEVATLARSASEAGAAADASSEVTVLSGSAADAGAAADAPSGALTASQAQTEAGAAADAPAVSAVLSASASEAGAAADAASQATVISRAAAEAGAAVDAPSASVSASATETGAAADAPAASATKPASAAEAGAAIDAPSVNVSAAGTAPGAATDAASVQAADGASSSETGAASDAGSSAATMAASMAEAGAGTDAPAASITAARAQAEAGAAADAASAIAQTALTVSDAGAAGDASSQLAALSGVAAEAGVAIDAGAASVLAAVTDPGAAADAASGSVPALPPVSLAEPGAAADAPSSSAAAFAGSVADAGAAVDAPSQLTAAAAGRLEAGAALDAGSGSAVMSQAGSEAGASSDASSSSSAPSASRSEPGAAADAPSGVSGLLSLVSDAALAAAAQSAIGAAAAAASEAAAAAATPGASATAAAAGVDAGAASDSGSAASPILAARSETGAAADAPALAGVVTFTALAPSAGAAADGQVAAAASSALASEPASPGDGAGGSASAGAVAIEALYLVEFSGSALLTGLFAIESAGAQDLAGASFVFVIGGRGASRRYRLAPAMPQPQAFQLTATGPRIVFVPAPQRPQGFRLERDATVARIKRGGE